MFGRGKRSPDTTELEGLITFFGSYHALKAEKLLKNAGKPAALVPGPRDISPNCGVALRFDYSDSDGVRSLLEEYDVRYEAIHHYPAG